MGVLTVGPVESIVSCLIPAVSFVGSLYIYKSNDVLHRIKAVSVVTLLSPLIILLWTSSESRSMSGVLHAIGFRWEGLLAALVLPLSLVVTLFVGPLVMRWYDEDFAYQQGGASHIRRVIVNALKDIQTWRVLIVAPIAEEIVFRGVMVPLVVEGGWSFPVVLLFSPLLFGLSHVHHHVRTVYVDRGDLRSALLSAIFQVCYTSMFGLFCSYVFVVTGHITPPILCHSFCNYMGVPEFLEALQHPNGKVIGGAFVLGIVGFYFLFPVILNPALYGSPYWR